MGILAVDVTKITKEIGAGMTFLIGIFLFGFFYMPAISAVGEVSYCAEKTLDDAWCQNVPIGEVDTAYRYVPTSCEATSYCRLGTCVNSQDGICMENTPEVTCTTEEGLWKEGEVDEVPQCQLGCCLMGGQAAYVTQTRCKKLSSEYNLETDFRLSVGSEAECISLATEKLKGACVFEKEFERNCKMTTQKECSELDASSEGLNVEFHEGFLCSAEELGTICGPRGGTTCVEGKDEVYFMDTCGNLANIYDNSKINSDEYWTKITGKANSCSVGSDPATCGNCDYFSGTTCKKYERGEDSVKPNYGDNICRNLDCVYEEQTYKHGETWCAQSAHAGPVLVTEEGKRASLESDFKIENVPGSRYFRMVCYNGDVTIEPCADYRAEVCLQSSITDPRDGGQFRTSACRVNMWQDCSVQRNKKDCENSDRRDCQWIPEETEVKEREGGIEGLISGISGNLKKRIIYGGRCVPLYQPGFNFWEAEGDAESICATANTQCVVGYEGKIGEKTKAVKNQECLNPGWANSMNNVCISLGDCGSKINYLDIEGYNEVSVERGKKKGGGF